MSHTIKIDDEVAALLETSRKRPGESADDVLRRWLGLPPGHTGQGGTGSTLTAPERAVLDVLTTTGTAMTAAQITAAAAISPAATGKALRYLEWAGKVCRHHVSGNATRRWRYEWRITDNRAPSET
ncbi:hypothetical protein ACQPZP_05505 [Spirillospora sp. CA-142024]|uniref:hypothetical protein n=1 Tax=Spirillospora sp. CA-142024 TaxID=3240036 RepID=UPI003D914C58